MSNETAQTEVHAYGNTLFQQLKELYCNYEERSRKEEIERLQREVEDLQRLAGPDIPSGESRPSARARCAIAAASFTSTSAPGSALFWRAIRSAPT